MWAEPCLAFWRLRRLRYTRCRPQATTSNTGTEETRGAGDRVGRPEAPLDPGRGPVQRFALKLRKLRQDAGQITYRELARRTPYTVSTLSKVASGQQLPSLQVTLAYVEVQADHRRQSPGPRALPLLPTAERRRSAGTSVCYWSVRHMPSSFVALSLVPTVLDGVVGGRRDCHPLGVMLPAALPAALGLYIEPGVTVAVGTVLGRLGVPMCTRHGVQAEPAVDLLVHSMCFCWRARSQREGPRQYDSRGNGRLTPPERCPAKLHVLPLVRPHVHATPVPR
ncbi:helix-turn-helix transcriptional regulator [Streptomyces sp. 5-10]|nr:helix-turn-helix transcriptional regulator [Streptomyces sp. 5-10]